VPQRVTRSSQRYAQQNGDNHESKSNLNGVNVENDINEESNVISLNSVPATGSNTTDKGDQSGRKAKRKKLEPQNDLEHDLSQGQQPPMFIPEFCPADYKLPEFNSFELYRRQKKKLHKEIMCLGGMRFVSRAPDSIDDYLLFNGPYLLDGDRLGVGLGVASVKRSSLSQYQQQMQVHQQQTPRLKMKFSRTRSGAFKLLSPSHHHLATNQRLQTYSVPQMTEAPKVLADNSPLHELFQSQERARQKMRIQHLKERERSILATEQEILRAYKQQYNLSACAYFSHQEKYHYIQESEGGTCENLDYPTTSLTVSQERNQVSPNSPSSQQTEKDDNATVLAIDDSELSTTEDGAEQRVIKKLITDLQALDDKWAQIKREMFIRHKNESDTLYAIQSLEWEWRAKEAGACDKEFVPRVEVSPLEY